MKGTVVATVPHWSSRAESQYSETGLNACIFCVSPLLKYLRPEHEKLTFIEQAAAHRVTIEVDGQFKL